MDRDLITKRLIDILTSPRFRDLSLDPLHLNEDTSLLNDVLMQIRTQKTGVYESPDRFTVD